MPFSTETTKACSSPCHRTRVPLPPPSHPLFAPSGDSTVAICSCLLVASSGGWMRLVHERSTNSTESTKSATFFRHHHHHRRRQQNLAHRLTPSHVPFSPPVARAFPSRLNGFDLLLSLYFDCAHEPSLSLWLMIVIIIESLAAKERYPRQGKKDRKKEYQSGLGPPPGP